MTNSAVANVVPFRTGGASPVKHKIAELDLPHGKLSMEDMSAFWAGESEEEFWWFAVGHSDTDFETTYADSPFKSEDNEAYYKRILSQVPDEMLNDPENEVEGDPGFLLHFLTEEEVANRSKFIFRALYSRLWENDFAEASLTLNGVVALGLKRGANTDKKGRTGFGESKVYPEVEFVGTLLSLVKIPSLKKLIKYANCI